MPGPKTWDQERTRGDEGEDSSFKMLVDLKQVDVAFDSPQKPVDLIAHLPKSCRHKARKHPPTWHHLSPPASRCAVFGG